MLAIQSETRTISKLSANQPVRLEAGYVGPTPFIHYTHRGCDVTDAGLQIEGERGAAQAEGRTGDEQEGRLHGLHDGAAELDGQFGARPVKTDRRSNHFLFY